MPVPFDHVVVAGAGAWGTALAVTLAKAGRRVTLWSRNPAVITAIKATGENTVYLPGISVPSQIDVTDDQRCVADAHALLCVIPTQYLREQLPAFRAAASDPLLPVALCCKGIERSTGQLVHHVLADVWPTAKAAILSGPSFAADVARGLPTAVTLADADPSRCARWQVTLRADRFRPYASDDLTGVALGGAVKNVLAIACGVVEGRRLGESAKAALIARGFAETLRLARAMGAAPDTLHGLSGLGDIILTCGSRQSRNMSLGVAIGEGASAENVIRSRRTVAEGAATAPILVDLADRFDVEMPIAKSVAALLSGQMTVDQAMNDLLARPLTQEAPS